MKIQKEYVICSDCFRRLGLKIMVERFGVKDGVRCPQCGSYNGLKLTLEQARELAGEYIVRGSYHRTLFGGSPVYMLSDREYDDKLFEDDPDLTLLLDKCGLNAFLYGPATWRVGNTTWLEDLQSKNKTTRTRAIKKIVDRCEITECGEGTVFYRLLTQLFGGSSDPLTYDAPQWQYQKKGRFGLRGTSVLYLSSSIESAIHECRVTVEDELFLASISINKALKIIDLTKTLNDSGDPWEDLSTSLNLLCSTGQDAYRITQAISREVFNRGYDGIFYWSFFNQITQEKGKNLVLFGSPIKEGKLEVISKDRLFLDQVQYSYSLGALI